MSQINVKKTDTPNTPATGRVGIFINLAGDAKVIDDAGDETLLAGIGDAPNDGDSYVRRNLAWESAAIGYQAAVERENNTVLFDKDYIIGNAAARTGNILFDFTGAQLGAVTEMIHDNNGSYTFPAEGEIYDFETTKLALVTGNVRFGFTIVDTTASSEIVKIQVSLTAAQLAEYNA